MDSNRIEAVFHEVFGRDDIVLTAETTARDVEGWDSFAHINLMVALEDAFSVAFTSEEMAAMRSVGDLVGILAARGVDTGWKA